MSDTKKQIKPKIGTWMWHLHHQIVCEPLTEPLINRIKYIKENKPEDEIELRLRLIKPVVGKLPENVIKAQEAYYKAWEAEEVVKAWVAYHKALRSKQMKELHKKQCGCGYSFTKLTIFTKKNGLVKYD